ncbi:hypothetical protein DLJ53_17965 [Acuticoccus sediminis]|uniref:Uncharacterized protein n=1 Tax=Acuticoccus sediminis TaxID=2184697 RepID=A0A8B2NVB1_9HYPH|nr:PAAR domain-containing protein [Acuticoccus sediminis]RAI01103.1 hypothetical protein DLJ53_17965 [Acuticoccus sediminis]
MTNKAHRVGDTNTAGAPVTDSLQTFFRDGGKLVAVDGSPVAPHTPFTTPHITTVTANGVSWFRINGIPANRTGDADSCGHARASSGAVINLNG